MSSHQLWGLNRQKYWHVHSHLISQLATKNNDSCPMNYHTVDQTISALVWKVLKWVSKSQKYNMSRNRAEKHQIARSSVTNINQSRSNAAEKTLLHNVRIYAIPASFHQWCVYVLLFLCFQNEREQIMTTNVWITQVSVRGSSDLNYYLIKASSALSSLRLILNLSYNQCAHVHSSRR